LNQIQIQPEPSRTYSFIHFHSFLAFSRMVFARCVFDIPRGLAELLVGTVRFGFDRTARLEGSVETVLVGSLATLGTRGCIRLLLRGVTRSGEGESCGSAASRLEDNGKPSEDTFCEMFSRRWGPFLFPTAFEAFDEWTRPRDAFAGCPRLSVISVRLNSNWSKCNVYSSFGLHVLDIPILIQDTHYHRRLELELTSTWYVIGLNKYIQQQWNSKFSLIQRIGMFVEVCISRCWNKRGSS
jgi:hypothetical protein